MLWNDLHVRATTITNGERGTGECAIEIQSGWRSIQGQEWSCGLELDYANEESLYCRPLRIENGKNPRRMAIPEESAVKKIAFLPPMSGLSDREFVKQKGEIGFLIGQGQTAQVLRNMCHNLYSNKDGEARWKELSDSIQSLFGVTLLPPKLISARDEILMSYREANGIELDYPVQVAVFNKPCCCWLFSTPIQVRFYCWMNRTPTWKFFVKGRYSIC